MVRLGMVEFRKTEKRWFAISPQVLLIDGTSEGLLTIEDACSIFKVKQEVTLKSSTQPPLHLEVKRFISQTEFYVGLKGNINRRADVSAYTVADGATLKAPEQNRSSIPQLEYERACYEEEPTIAKRVVIVDECGRKAGNETNPIHVDTEINVNDINVDIKLPNTPETHKITASSTAEFSYILPDNTKCYVLREVDGTGKWLLAFTMGVTATAPIPIHKRKYYNSPSTDLPDNSKIYLKAPSNGACLYLEVWRYLVP